MHTVETNLILSADVAKRKLRRMAFEVAERNAGCDALIIAGVSGNGVVVAKNMMDELRQILPIPMELIIITINKHQPLEVSIDTTMNFDDKTIIVVDDVADSGRTLLYALKPLLSFRPRSIQTLALVERSHKLFPVQTDYRGLSIATTLQEHILVKVNGEEISGVYLQ